MSFFKYLSPKWADAMVERGSLRIGTLYGFRDAEALDSERADPLEGVRQYFGSSKFVSDRDKAATEFMASKGVVISGCVFENKTGGPAFMHEEGPPDCYIYCISNIFDKATCDSMGGACIEIMHVGFFDAIGSHLLAKGLVKGHGIVADCVYGNKTEPFTNDRPHKPPGWLVKPEKYRHQAEARAMWVPTKMTSQYGTIRSQFIKYVTLNREDVFVEALIHSPYIRRVR